MIHNWPRLGFSAGGPTQEELADGWFNEVIAEFYSLVLPYRFMKLTYQLKKLGCRSLDDLILEMVDLRR